MRVYTRANLEVVAVAHPGTHRYPLAGLHFEADGSTVATDGRRILVVGPRVAPEGEKDTMTPEVLGYAPDAAPGTPEAFTATTASVREALAVIPERGMAAIQAPPVLRVPVGRERHHDIALEMLGGDTPYAPYNNERVLPVVGAETPAIKVNPALLAELLTTIAGMMKDPHDGVTLSLFPEGSGGDNWCKLRLDGETADGQSIVGVLMGIASE